MFAPTLVKRFLNCAPDAHFGLRRRDWNAALRRARPALAAPTLLVWLIARISAFRTNPRGDCGECPAFSAAMYGTLLVEKIGPSCKRHARSEERRVGKECVSTCRSRWSQYH